MIPKNRKWPRQRSFHAVSSVRPCHSLVDKSRIGKTQTPSPRRRHWCVTHGNTDCYKNVF